jgi:hypothetical protein
MISERAPVPAARERIAFLDKPSDRTELRHGLLLLFAEERVSERAREPLAEALSIGPAGGLVFSRPV